MSLLVDCHVQENSRVLGFIRCSLANCWRFFRAHSKTSWSICCEIRDYSFFKIRWYRFAMYTHTPDNSCNSTSSDVTDLMQLLEVVKNEWRLETPGQAVWTCDVTIQWGRNNRNSTDMKWCTHDTYCSKHLAYWVCRWLMMCIWFVAYGAFHATDDKTLICV